MKIGFDLRPFLSDETGVGVYFKNLLNAMSKIDTKDTFYLLSSSFKERFQKRELPHFKNMRFKDFRIPVSILNFLWFRLSLPPMGMFFGKQLDITHSPNPLYIPGGKKKIITIHDLSFLDSPDLAMPEAVRYFSKQIGRSIKRADAIIAVSEFTRSRIHEIFGKDAYEKTSVIYHGSDINELAEKKPPFNVPEKYFLFTGTIEPRKNLTTLIRGFSLAKKDLEGIKLILAGKDGTQSLEIKRLINVLKLEEDVLITGYLQREELKYLYLNSESLIFPSHYEGFGLPLLEAASSGIPSIASDIEVFREIFQEYPIYFDKDDPESLANAMMLIASDKKLCDKKKMEALETGKNFSWAKSAEQTLELYDKTGKLGSSR